MIAPGVLALYLAISPYISLYQELLQVRGLLGLGQRRDRDAALPRQPLRQLADRGGEPAHEGLRDALVHEDELDRRAPGQG